MIDARASRAAAALIAFFFLCRATGAEAGCSSPLGNAGDVQYSSTQNILAYCNGTSWIAMGSSSTTSYGTLTTNDFCIATNGTTIACNVGSTGTGNVVLSASPTLTGTIAGASETLSGQLAVGTSTLNGAVNVNGTVNATSFAGSGASLTGIGTANLGGIAGTPSSTTYLRGDGTWATASGGVSGGTANYLAYWTGATTLGTANVSYSGGKVGIGTAAPNALLHVYGGSNVDPSLTYGAAATAIINGGAQDIAFGGALTIAPWSAWIQVRAPGGIADPLAINPLGGNVGIGTNAPAAKLGVSNTTTPATQTSYGIATGVNGIVDLGLGSDASYAYLQSWNAKPLYINNQGNNIYFGGNLGIGAASAPNQIYMTGSQGLLSLGAKGWTDPGSTGAAIITDNSSYKALMIVGNNVAGNSGYGREVKVWDFLNVQGWIKSASGGYIFPDGTTQTTAASGSSPVPGTWCGLAQGSTGCVGVGTDCTTTSTYTNVFSCNGSSLATSCPSGYTKINLLMTYVDCYGTGAYYSSTCWRTCAKN